MTLPSDVTRDLERFSLFQDVSSDRLEAFAEMCVYRTYGKGRRIFDDNEPADRLYLIKTGIVTVHLFSITPAYDITIAKLYAGDILGEFGMLENAGRSTAATCLEEAELIELPVEDFLAFLEENASVGFTVMRNLARIVAGRVKTMNRRILNMTRSSLF